MTAKRLYEHYSKAAFERRHDYACAIEPVATEQEMQFLRDIWWKYRRFGAAMYFSDKQRAHLQQLAVRGGWRRSMEPQQEAA